MHLKIKEKLTKINYNMGGFSIFIEQAQIQIDGKSKHCRGSPGFFLKHLGV